MEASNDMTIAQVAKQLTVSPMTVRRYVRSGRMKAYRVGGRWRVPEAAVTAFVQLCSDRAQPVKQ